MKESDIQRIKAVLLYILNKMPSGSNDIYHIVKAAFYAQKEHFVNYGLPLFNDKIIALKFGPVPSLVYNVLRVARGDSDPYRFCDDRLLSRLSAPIDFDAEYFYTTINPDMSCLSNSAIECLDSAIHQVSTMGFVELKNDTHGVEWSRAYNSRESHQMDDINIAREGGASQDMLQYLADTLEWDKMTN